MRFIIMNRPTESTEGEKTAEDQKYLDELRMKKDEVAHHIEAFEFHLAAENAYHYFWHEFADKIIESAKPRLQSDDLKDKSSAHQTLLTILTESLKMLHPFMPFTTEAAWQHLREIKLVDSKTERGLLIVEPWE